MRKVKFHSSALSLLGAHFLRIARGSAYELETQLVLAEDLGLCGREAASKVAATLQEAIRLLQGLIAALERRTER